MGRLARDPNIRYTDESLCIARFTLAVDRRRRRGPQQNAGEQTADFISCVAFGKIAEHIEKYYHKGMKTALSGRIQTGSYDHKDGYKVYTTEVVIEEMEFAEKKQTSEQYPQNNTGYQQNEYYQQQSAGSNSYAHQDTESLQHGMNEQDGTQMSIDDDELPPGYTMLDDDDVPF